LLDRPECVLNYFQKFPERSLVFLLYLLVGRIRLSVPEKTSLFDYTPFDYHKRGDCYRDMKSHLYFLPDDCIGLRLS
jgi:hypothetical protein